MGPKEDRIDEWARHYDTLLWTVTTIFLAADGALLVYCSEDGKFRTSLAFGGMWLNVVTAYLATSMRELRHGVGSTMDNGLSPGRKLYQWLPFISIFALIAGGWILLLVENINYWQDNIHGWLKSIHDGVCFSLIVLGVFSVSYIAWLGTRFWKPLEPRARDGENDNRGWVFKFWVFADLCG